MGFMNSFRRLMGVDMEEEQELEEQQEPMEEEQSSVRQPQPISLREMRAEERRGKIGMQPSDRPQVVLVKPESFEEASGIADHLNNRHTVVLNLEAADREVSRRLVDFLSGVAYANKGTLKRVAKATFLITPSSIDMLGELADEVESTGLY